MGSRQRGWGIIWSPKKAGFPNLFGGKNILIGSSRYVTKGIKYLRGKK